MVLVGELEVASAQRDKLDTHQFSLTDAVPEAGTTQEVIEIGISGGYNDFVVIYFVRLRPVCAGGNA